MEAYEHEQDLVRERAEQLFVCAETDGIDHAVTIATVEIVASTVFIGEAVGPDRASEILMGAVRAVRASAGPRSK